MKILKWIVIGIVATWFLIEGIRVVSIPDDFGSSPNQSLYTICIVKDELISWKECLDKVVDDWSWGPDSILLKRNVKDKKWLDKATQQLREAYKIERTEREKLFYTYNQPWKDDQALDQYAHYKNSKAEAYNQCVVNDQLMTWDNCLNKMMDYWSLRYDINNSSWLKQTIEDFKHGYADVVIELKLPSGQQDSIVF